MKNQKEIKPILYKLGKVVDLKLDVKNILIGYPTIKQIQLAREDGRLYCDFSLYYINSPTANCQIAFLGVIEHFINFTRKDRIEEPWMLLSHLAIEGIISKKLLLIDVEQKFLPDINRGLEIFNKIPVKDRVMTISINNKTDFVSTSQSKRSLILLQIEREVK